MEGNKRTRTLGQIVSQFSNSCTDFCIVVVPNVPGNNQRVQRNERNIPEEEEEDGGVGRKRSRDDVVGFPFSYVGEMEEKLANEIVHMRLHKMKVSRQLILDRACMLAHELHLPDFKSTKRWLFEVFHRHGFSLRTRDSYFLTLREEQLVYRAVDYFLYLQSHIKHLDLSTTLLMDEVAIYFQDIKQHSVSFKDRQHTILSCSGFSGMRISAVISVWADGRKAPPLIIHKAERTAMVVSDCGIFSVTQPNGWIESSIIIELIDMMFPCVKPYPNKSIIWDSCQIHLSDAVRDHCHKRRINLIVIPGGLTHLLQATDIGICKELKDNLLSIIHTWMNSEHVLRYAVSGNPRPPSYDVVSSWLKDCWRQVSQETINHSIAAAGFSKNFEDWHIAKDDVYGGMFKQAWESSEGWEVGPLELEGVPQDDDMFCGIDFSGKDIFNES